MKETIYMLKNATLIIRSNELGGGSIVCQYNNGNVEEIRSTDIVKFSGDGTRLVVVTKQGEKIYESKGSVSGIVKKLSDTFLSEEKVKELEEKRKIEQIYAKESERLAFEKITRLNKLYEYDVVRVYDDRTGGTNINELKAQLQTHAMQGWKLVTTFANELGKNSQSIGLGGMSMGTNATVDEIVLIFERCIADYAE